MKASKTAVAVGVSKAIGAEVILTAAQEEAAKTLGTNDATRGKTAWADATAVAVACDYKLPQMEKAYRIAARICDEAGVVKGTGGQYLSTIIAATRAKLDTAKIGDGMGPREYRAVTQAETHGVPVGESVKKTEEAVKAAKAAKSGKPAPVTRTETGAASDPARDIGTRFAKELQALCKAIAFAADPAKAMAAALAGADAEIATQKALLAAQPAPAKAGKRTGTKG